MVDKDLDGARRAGRTLWDKANDLSKVVRCVVCDRLLEPRNEGYRWVLIGGRSWPRSAHGTRIHPGCLEAGHAQAVREGLTWSVQHVDRPDSSQPSPTDRSQSEPQCSHDSCMHAVPPMKAIAALIEASEEDLDVCSCECHASCPVAGHETVTEATLRKSCTCPGSKNARMISQAGRMRNRPRAVAPQSFGETWNESRRTHAAREEAGAIVVTNAEGKTRAELRDLYVAELRRRDVRPPPQPFLDMQLDHALRNQGSVSMGYAEGLVVTARVGFSFAKNLWKHAQPTSRASTIEVYRVPHDTENNAEVELDRAAQGWIGGELDAVLLVGTGLALVDVEIEHGAPGSDDEPVVVYVDDRRAGIISGTDVPLFQPALRDAEEMTQRLCLPAVRSRAPDGAWRLHVSLPLKSG
jgi:hypothetical protein